MAAELALVAIPQPPAPASTVDPIAIETARALGIMAPAKVAA